MRVSANERQLRARLSSRDAVPGIKDPETGFAGRKGEPWDEKLKTTVPETRDRKRLIVRG